ncbi:MAG: hypothetical protein ACLTR6_10670 [Clostridium fessum]
MLHSESKRGITKNQTEEDACVLNYEDPVLREFGETLKDIKVVHLFQSAGQAETRAST